ncbi:hypothetical protein N7462_011524 [Penicillium macrosclerotiorum]|uniref:uncharacterized protein n=1 Tax=Penicillium macrosclerotiorum TaxID=303699 RepID=UPI0025475DAD|nr:uncharacterized protein N7462_011524 [Penicillium macrosclerotiorum]KAJ5664711.1 hypothetical protein N7462_011524 [Penicillium macrosclerotiorum]
MTSSNSNNQHPPTSSADLPNQPTSTNHFDPNSGYAPNDNQLAGLVEAATAAADQDVSHQWAAPTAVAIAAAAAGHHQLEGYGTDMHLGDDGFGDANFAASMGGGRHLRVQNDHTQGSGLSRTVSKKRKRNDDNLDPALAGAGLSGSQQQHSQPSQQNQHGYVGDSIDIRSVPPQSLSEARAVGVHSAAALFRQPSSNKKYTRPPMSKLFASLELSPENFLHLQAAAKTYMLNDDHPERRDCVGQRGKGDTEMVKLRLWNCVRHFLEAEGNGERFFGEDVVNEGMGPRTYIWPRDQQKIISLVIPLLRRMVTNERQRQYAIETRKGGSTEERRRRKTNESFQDLNGPRFSPEEQLQMHNQSQSMPPPPPSVQSHPPVEPDQSLDLGLTDLLLEGYTVDWNQIGRCYDMYNHDYELDNLWSLSGLQQSDWRGIVAAVDSHYHVIHDGGFDCSSPCEDTNINRIIHADCTSSLPWRIGGGRNVAARDEFASSITRDVSRIIRENIATRQGAQPTSQGQAGTEHQSHPQQLFVPIQGSTPQGATNPAPDANSHTQIYLRINILQHGKRVLPRLDLPAEQCPSIATIKESVLRRYNGQIPGLPPMQESENLEQQVRDDTAAASWKVKALLPSGLVSIQSEKDWTFAILSADTVDWMDGDLKVLVEIEGNHTP